MSIKIIALVVLILIPIATANNSTGLIINATTEPFPSLSNGTSGTTGGSSSSSSASSSGGGGGMGAVSDEPFNNIAQSYRLEKDWKFNSSVSYSLQKYDVYEVVIKTIQSESNVPLMLNILRNRSNKTTVAPAGQVYKYFNLYLGTRKSYGDITIKFKVNITWNEGNALLMKWNGKDWIALGTQATTADSFFKYYQSNTDSLSNFAIVAKPEIQPAPPAPVSIKATTSGTPITPAMVAAAQSPEASKESGGFNPWIIVIGIFLIIVIGIVYFTTA